MPETLTLGSTKSVEPTSRKVEQKVEPMSVCFMDHITRAVETSFSKITEEEERKEREKALAQKEAAEKTRKFL